MSTTDAIEVARRIDRNACRASSAGARHATNGVAFRAEPMDLDRLVSRLNPLVACLLRSPLHPLLSGGVMLVQVTGRRTGRRYWIPVGYQREGDRITVLVSRARRKQWWRNYREPGPVAVLLEGRMLHGRAHVVRSDSAAFRTAIETTLRRLPALGGQFGVRYDRTTGLTAPQWRAVAANGAVVAIDVGAPPPSRSAPLQPSPRSE
jgi:hypothetical protein